jgi:Rrf2 family nitric oxide-sensitive transcriptional repressor
MRLTPQSDSALRLLLLLALAPDEPFTVERIAARYRLSRERLAHIARLLARAGLVEEHRGGLRLAKPASHIDLGTVMHATDIGYGLQIVTADGGRRDPVKGEKSGFRTALGGFSLADLMSGTEAQRSTGKT